MSVNAKIDKLCDSSARLEEHMLSVIEAQKKQEERMDCMCLDITSLKETRVYARTMFKFITWLCVYTPTLGYGIIKIWKWSKHIPNSPINFP